MMTKLNDGAVQLLLLLLAAVWVAEPAAGHRDGPREIMPGVMAHSNKMVAFDSSSPNFDFRTHRQPLPRQDFLLPRHEEMRDNPRPERSRDFSTILFPDLRGPNSRTPLPPPGVVLVGAGEEEGDPESIDRETPAAAGGAASDDGAIELPEDLDIDKLDMADLVSVSNVANVDDFARMFGLELPEQSMAAPGAQSAGGISARFGSGGAAGNYMRADSARCEPENVTVNLELPEELNVLYFPTCVRLQRCGGCCTGPLLECQETEFKPVTLQVLRIEATPSNTRRSGMETGRSRRPGSRRRERRQTAQYYDVHETQHTACACKCRVQEQDCSPLVHDYVQNECACRCKNRDEGDKCGKLKSTHYWDNETCQCFCLKTEFCSTGQYFDHANCRCTNAPLLRSGAGAARGRSLSNNNVATSVTFGQP